MYQNIVCILLGYAMIFAPGCKQRTDSNLKSDDASADTLTNEKISQVTEDVGLGDGYNRLFSALKKEPDLFNVYVEDENGVLKRIDSKTFANFNPQNPIKNPNTGKGYNRYYLHRADNKAPSIVGIEVNLDAAKNKTQLIVKEIRYQSRSAYEKGKELVGVTSAELSKRVASGASVVFDLGERSADRFKASVQEQSLKFKSFMSRLSEKIAPQSNTQGTQLTSTGTRVMAWVLGAVSIAMITSLVFASLIVVFDTTVSQLPAALLEAGKYLAVIFVACILIAIAGYVLGRAVDMYYGETFSG